MNMKWLCLAFLSFSLLACVNDEGSRTSDDVVEQKPSWNPMLRNYADNVILPTYERVAQRSTDWIGDAGALSQYCAALGTPDETSARESAQQAWRDLMSAWQQAELYQLGPLVDNGGALRNRIYAYGSTAPLSECAVDQSVILAQGDDFNIGSRSNNSRGLAALEYLLFNDDLTHQCAPQVALTQTWNTLSELERKTQRCDYALQVAKDVDQASRSLISAWQEEGGNYRFEFIHPSLIEDHLKALSDALFYLEVFSKDLKVGIPVGIHTNCRQIVCPDAAESLYSDTAFANLRANLLGFQQLLLGGAGLGFDDVIIDAGFPEVVEAFIADSNAAIAIIDSAEQLVPEQSLSEQLMAIQQSGNRSACDNAAANPTVEGGIEVCRLHGMFKRITDRLRTDFVAIVNVDLPDRAQSDND